MAELDATNVTGAVTQSVAASSANHLMRKTEVDTALALKLNAADASVTNARTPTGAAGGDLVGTYPNPTLAAVGTAGTYTAVTTDAKGRVIAGTTLGSGDVPAHASTHKSGGVDVIRLDELAAPTANISLNSNKLTNVTDPASAQDAATQNYVLGRKVTDLTAPTGSFAMNAQKITGLADPTLAQDAATQSYVLARKITDLTAPTGSFSMGAQLITNVADPVSAQDAATKAYVDSAVSGIDIKSSCRLATTVNHSLSGLAAIDGVTPLANDRILAKDQTAGSQNGIYVAAAGAWARATDADTSAEMSSGVFTFVTEGTAGGNNGYVLTTDDPIVLGTTALVFTQFSGAGQVTNGTGLSKTGNTLAVILGTTASTVCEGNDARLTNSRQMATALADVSFGTFKGTNLGTPTLSTDAATMGYVLGLKVHNLTAPTSALAMNAQLITGVADPVSAQDAATRAYVLARKVTDLTAPSVSFAMNAQKITGLADPTLAQDAVTLASMQAAIAAVTFKATVRIASTANLALSGLAAIDGVTPVATDRILAKNQTTTSQNGIYVAAAGAWARATDADASAEVKAGLLVFVSEGSTLGNTWWSLTTDDPITLNTTGLTFAAMGDTVTAGTGITKTASVMALDYATRWTAFAVPNASVPMGSQKLINVLNPTSAQDAATKAFVDEQHLTGWLVWVDAVNGSDSTGTRGRSDLPYLTLNAAKTAASSADTIVVLPGTYMPTSNLLKAGINWHFMNGVLVNAIAAHLFNDSVTGANGAVICNITGHGVFVADSFQIFGIVNGGSDIYFEGRKLIAEGTGTLGVLGAGTTRIKCPVQTSMGVGWSLTGGIADIAGDTLSCEGIAIDHFGATAVVRMDSIDSASASGAVFSAGGQLDVYARKILCSAGSGVQIAEDSTAFVTIHGAIIKSTLATAAGKAVYTDGNELRLHQCLLVSNLAGTPATVSIDAPGAVSVRFFGCFANLAKGANITNLLAVTNLEVDTDVS